MSLHGTNDEERTDLNKEESRYVRARSRRLLGSLLLPLRPRILWAVALVVVSTALRVSGPALIAFGIDSALPKALVGDYSTLGLTVFVYLSAAILTALLTYYFL
ncbi:MAG: hypothetical protein RL696_501, partial [Actinomycetota bacterium]